MEGKGNKKKKTIAKGIQLIAVILSVLLLAACGSGSSVPASSGGSSVAGSAGSSTAALSGEPIKFAFSGPMTGDYAEYGNNFWAACQIAMEEINAEGGLLGGRPVEFVQYDDKNAPEEAGVIAEMIASDPEICAVFGHFASGVAMTAANTYLDVGIVLMSASSSHPDFSGMGRYLFRNTALISQEVQNVLQICEVSGAKKVGVLVLKNDWGQGARGQLDIAYAQVEGKLGFEIVAIEEVMDGSDDFSAVITKFDAAECDTIFVLTMYAAFAPFADQYRAVNPEINMVSVGSAYSTELINLGGAAVEGVRLVAGFNPETDDPIAKNFVERYQAKMGKSPDNMAAQTYENVMIVAEAIERAGTTDRTAIMEALYETDYQGVTGHSITFNEIGDAQKTQIVFEIQNGKFVELTDLKLKLWEEFVASL